MSFSVVVRAVGHQRGQAIGALPGAHQVVGAGFAGAVRAAGRVGGGFGEQVIGAMQVAIHLVGADVVKAKGRFFGAVQAPPVAAGRFQQGVGADDVGFDEGRWPVDGAIDMAFGGQVHDGIGLVLGKDAVEFCAVANIDLLKRVARAGAALGQRGQVARVGQLIDIDDAVARVANDVAHQGGANKAGTAGNQEFHGV